MLRKLPKLLEDPNIQYPTLSPDFNFSDYISEWKDIIAKVRPGLGKNADLIINTNAPFEIRSAQTAKIGILLIHGLLDSCFTMKDIAEHLTAPQRLIRAVLLPGHGTVPGALLHIHYQEWLQTVRYGIDSLAKEVDKIFIIGYSTGAIAGLYEALQNEQKIAGIISFAPAFKIKSPFAGLAPLPLALGKQWLGANEEIDYAKYTSITYQSILQVHQLGKEVKKQLQNKKLSCRSLMIVSAQDEIISTTACQDYFQQDTHPQNEMIYYANPSKSMPDKRITVRHSSYPEQRILNFSHICLTISPNNPHYGKNGDYPLASHVDLEKQTYFSGLNTLDSQIYQKLYEWKLTSHHHQRLTFNPDFDFMIKKVQNFIDMQ